MELDEIRQLAENRANKLYEYSCSNLLDESEKFHNIYLWFVKERYSWYSGMVLEKFLQKYIAVDEYRLAYMYLLSTVYEKNNRKQEKERTFIRIHDEFLHISFEKFEDWAKKLLKFVFVKVGDTGISFTESENSSSDKIEKEENKEVTAPLTDEFVPVDANYITGKAIGIKQKDYFFGREKLIASIAGDLRADSKNMILLYGEYRIGKSSVLEYLKHELESDYEIISIDLSSASRIEAIYREIYSKIKKKYPRVYNEIVRIQTNNEYEVREKFSDCIDKLSEAVFDAGKKKILFIFDEFQKLVYSKTKEELEPFIDILKKKADQEEIQLILAGTEYAREILTLSSARTISPEKVRYLDFNATKQLFDNPIKINKTISRFSDHPELLDYVANLTAGQPLISQMMANEIVNYLNDHKQNMVDPQTIKYAENQIINSSDFRVAFLSSLSSENENNSDWDESDVKMICHLITAATLKNEELTEEQLLEKLTHQQNKVYQELKRRSIILMDVDTHNLSVLVPLFGKWCHYWKEKTVALKGVTAKE